MAKKSSYAIGGLVFTAMMIGALPAAQGIGAASKQFPNFQVNRSAKGDRLVAPQGIALRQTPAESARETVKTPEQPGKRRIMDGCDPMFSPVTVPAMAHVPGRCVG